jgi:hypothetical protein
MSRRRAASVESAARPSIRAAANNLATIASNVAIESVADAAVAAQDKVRKLYDSARDKTSRAHTATVDMSGSILGVLSFESLNWMIRYLGDKFPAIGGSVDYWQSVPHLVIGLVAYWGELLTRKKPSKEGQPVWPSMPREIASEWSKVFILLGAHNLIRALRVRRKDAKADSDRLVQAEAELARVKEELKKYQK